MSFKIVDFSKEELKCHDLSARKCFNDCKQGYYLNKKDEKVDISSDIYRCLEGTKFYSADYDYEVQPLENEERCLIEIRNESTMKGAYRMSVIEGKKNVCALNFANAFTPGGGVLYGSRAQEESLCRSCALYYSLIQENPSQFYDFHNQNSEQFGAAATNSLIFTPNCPAWKVDEKLLDQPFLTSFISAAAIDNSFHEKTRDEARVIHDERIKRIIDCAIVNGVKNIVLGAFGCGAFHNNPVDISQSFKKVLIDDGKRFYFESISFSIIGFSTVNIDAFSKTFGIEITKETEKEKK